MPTVIEIATAAGATPDQVIRVVNGEPVSREVEIRVEAAMDSLGRPAYPQRMLPERVGPAGVAADSPDRLLARFADAAAELESTLPVEVGSVVYEALRVEVRPVVEHVAGLQSVFDGIADELRLLRREVAAERRDRVADLELQVELLRASWASVDRRLGRLERTLARRPADPPGPARATLWRLDGQQPSNGALPGTGTSA